MKKFYAKNKIPIIERAQKVGNLKVKESLKIFEKSIFKQRNKGAEEIELYLKVISK